MQSSAEPLGKAVRSPPWLRGDDDADAERLIVRGTSLAEDDEVHCCFDDAGSAAQDEVQQLKALLAAVTERAAAAGVVFEDSIAAELDAVLFADEDEQQNEAEAAAASDVNDDTESREAEADACAASADNDDDYREPSSWVESDSVPLPPPPPQSWTAASDDGQFQVDDTDDGSPVQVAGAAGVYSGSSAQEVADFALLLDDAVDQWDNDDDPGYVAVHVSEDDFYAMEEEAALEAAEYEVEEHARAQLGAQRSAYADSQQQQQLYDDGAGEHSSNSNSSSRSSSTSSSRDSGIDADLALAEAALHAANAVHSCDHSQHSDNHSAHTSNSSNDNSAHSSEHSGSYRSNSSSSAAAAAAAVAAGDSDVFVLQEYDVAYDVAAATGGASPFGESHYSAEDSRDEAAALAAVAAGAAAPAAAAVAAALNAVAATAGAAGGTTAGADTAVSSSVPTADDTAGDMLSSQHSAHAVTASALQLEPLNSTSLVADADFDQLLHSLSLVSPTANNGSADGSIGPCSALTLSPRGDEEGEEGGIGESQFPTVVSQSSDGGNSSYDAVSSSAVWAPPAAVHGYAFANSSSTATATATFATTAATTAAASDDAHSGADAAASSADLYAKHTDVADDGTDDVIDDDGESLPDEAYEEQGGPDDDVKNLETFGAKEVFKRAADGSVLSVAPPVTSATATAASHSHNHEHGCCDGHSHMHSHSGHHRRHSSSSTGSQAAAVAVAAAAAVLDTDDDIRDALSQLHLGSSSGHLLHATQQQHSHDHSCCSGHHHAEHSHTAASTTTAIANGNYSTHQYHSHTSSSSSSSSSSSAAAADDDQQQFQQGDDELQVDEETELQEDELEEESDVALAARLGMTADADLGSFNLKVVYERGKTGFEESKHFRGPRGAVIAGRYVVEHEIGAAAFSTTIQCRDLQYSRRSSSSAHSSNSSSSSSHEHVCLKVIKNNKDFFDQSLDEIKLLQRLSKHGNPDDHHVLRLLDHFYYKEHLFIVSELLQQNLYEFGKRLRAHRTAVANSNSNTNTSSSSASSSDGGVYFTPNRLARVAMQCLEALAYINSLGLMHCDVKPENIVMRSYTDVQVKLIDFGSSCYASDRLPLYAQSRSYRAPEVVLGLEYGMAIDVWSLGAVLAELITGAVLFQNESVPSMLARITAVVGELPHYMVLEGREAFKYYTSAGVLYERSKNHEADETEPDGFNLLYPKATNLSARLRFNDPGALHFISKLLNPDPLTRPLAAEALQHSWIEASRAVPQSELQYPAF